MAAALGADVSDVDPSDAGDILAERVIGLMRATGMPNGLSAIGYGESDVNTLVEGTLSQHRVTKISPRPVDAEALKELFRASMVLW